MLDDNTLSLFNFGSDDRIRRCTACNEVKLLSEFHKSKYSGGHKRECRDCCAEKLAVWRDGNREYIREYAAKRWQNDPEYREKQRAQQRESYHRNPANHRNNYLRNTFKITLAEYNEMVQSQGGTCAICNQKCKSGKVLAVDHDRSCCPGNKSCGECIRALLCGNCNMAIGLLQDDPKLMSAAIDYLTKHSKETP